MTMTEFQAVMAELSEIRASLGRAFGNIQTIALSLKGCQTLCTAAHGCPSDTATWSAPADANERVVPSA